MSVDYRVESDLSVNSLIYAINLCRNKPHFRAGVYISLCTQRDEYRNWLYWIIRTVQHSASEIVAIYQHNDGTCRVQFENQSQLDIVRPNDGARGHRFCTVIIDDLVSDETRAWIIMPTIIPYDCCIPID